MKIMNNDQIINYEEKSLNAWPSLKTVTYKGCLIRISNGYTKRANSSNCLYINNKDLDSIIFFSEQIFKSFNQPSIFKIIENSHFQDLDNELDKLQYRKIDKTDVMQLDLSEYKNTIDISLHIDNEFTDEWLRAFLKINNIKDKDTTIQMLKNICIPLLTASIKVDEKIIACGYGAWEDEYIGFYDIIVDKKYRGYGYGKKLMIGLLNKSKELNIKYAYLQVVSANRVAKSLYEKIGFAEMYKYCYRIKL